MGAIADARTALQGALGDVAGARLYEDMAATIDPPGLVVGPAVLSWEGRGHGMPAAVTVVAYLIERADDRALDRLTDRLPEVVDAIESLRQCQVMRADPGAWVRGNLPCYEITVEMDVAL